MKRIFFLVAQWVNSTPPLYSRNRCAPLTVEHANTFIVAATSMGEPTDEDVPLSILTPAPLPAPIQSMLPTSDPTVGSFKGLSRWEKRLPRCLVVASTPLEHSLQLKVELETTNTQETIAVTADKSPSPLTADQHRRHKLERPGQITRRHRHLLPTDPTNTDADDRYHEPPTSGPTVTNSITDRRRLTSRQ